MPMIRLPRRLPSESGGEERRIIGPTGVADAALAGLGEAVTGIAGAVAGIAEERARERDVLTEIREEAAFETEITAGIAAIETRKREFALSDGYTEEGLRELDSSMKAELFERARSRITSPRLRAKADGKLAGALNADLTEDLAVYRLARGAQAIQRASEWAGEMIANPNILLDMHPGIAASVADKLARIVEANPQLGEEADVAKARTWQMIRNAHIAAGPKQELRLWGEVAEGGYAELGEAAISADRAQAVRRADDLMDEIETEERFGLDYGEVIDNGGRFPTFQRKDADLSDLEELSENLDWLPEGRRGMYQARVEAMALTRSRRSVVMASETEPHFENQSPISIPTNSESFFSYEAYAQRFVIPWLSERPGEGVDPRTHMLDRVAFLSREINAVGYLSPSFGTWAQQVIQNAGSQPDTAMAIAMAVGLNGYNGVLAQKLRTSLPELELEQRGMLPRQLWNFTEENEEFLDGMARLSGHDPGLAVKIVQDSMALGRDRRTKAKAEAPAGELERLFAPDELSEADKKAADVAGAVTDGLRESFERAGHDVEAISDDVESQIRLLTRGFFYRNLRSGMPEQAALESAADLAVGAVLKETPPLTIAGRTYMNKDVDDLLERDANGVPKYGVEMIEFELRSILDELDLGEHYDRAIIVKPPGEALGKGQFRIMIEGADGDPWRMLPIVADMRGEVSAWQRLKDEVTASSLEAALGAKPGSDPRATSSELLESLMLEGHDWRRWASQVERPDVGDLVAESFRMMIAEGNPAAAAGVVARMFGKAVPPKLDPSFEQAIKDAGGGQMWRRWPSIAKEADRLHRDMMRQRLEDYVRFRDTGPGVPETMPLDMKTQAQRDVREAVLYHVRARLEREFSGKTPDVITKSIRTGKLPSEEK